MLVFLNVSSASLNKTFPCYRSRGGSGKAPTRSVTNRIITDQIIRSL